jgi:hypothetical protein
MRNSPVYVDVFRPWSTCPPFDIQAGQLFEGLLVVAVDGEESAEWSDKTQKMETKMSIVLTCHARDANNPALRHPDGPRFHFRSDVETLLERTMAQVEWQKKGAAETV